MIPLPITVEQYAKFFPPASDYILVKKLIKKYSDIRGIAIPQSVATGQVAFISVGEIVKISDIPSADPYIEDMKSIFKELKWVGYAYHVAAEVPILPQFELPKDIFLCLIHVKDVSQCCGNLDELFSLQEAHEKEMTNKMIMSK